MATNVLVDVLAGFVLVPLLQVLKRYANLKGVAMVWTAFIASFITAVPVAIFSGQLKWDLVVTDPVVFFSRLGEIGSTIFGIATLLYKSVKDKMELSNK